MESDYIENLRQVVRPKSDFFGKGQEMEIREARTESEREAIYRLRYEVYVEQMKRTQQWADHHRRRIFEPLDLTARIMGVFRGGVPIATTRVNFSGNSDFDDADFWGVKGFDLVFPGNVSLGTKLVIDPRFRSGMLFVKLIRESFRLALQLGAQVMLMDCNDPVLPLFERLGFVAYKRAIHPEYGRVTLLAIFFESSRHFERLKSPLLPIVRQFVECAETEGALNN